MHPSERRQVVILGSTGSIGRQAIEVVTAHPDRFQLVGLGAGRDRESLERQADELGVAHTGLGEKAAVELATTIDANVVLNGIVGAAGLRVSVAALEAGKVLALANKESLVAGGEACLAAAARGGGRLAPVDSEHAAITQCLQGHDRDTVKRVVLTASGGPFRARADLGEVTPEQALAHPTWSMGPKITVDSATLMNKGLEVIEAHHLFGFAYEQIEVLVHPQSVVHGIVEFADGSVLMQAAPTDMRIPIQAALSCPEMLPAGYGTLDLAATGSLDFEPVDRKRFPAVDLAFEAGRKGRSYPAALNAANEVAVSAFLGGSISFTDIPRIIEEVLDDHDPMDATELDAVLEVDAWARSRAEATMVALGGVS
ncbi:MAG: 1-deoxy-D-xylulose-5-phosphate reductoisomerase [Actinomycetota bacterium]